MLSTLTPEGVQTVQETTRQRIREVNKEVEQLGATVKAQWATLGRFDFVNVVEAPDEADDGARVARARLARDRRTTRRPDRDPDRRLHRCALTASGARRRRGRARARDRARAACARRRRPRSSARRATPASRARRRRSTAPTIRRRSPRREGRPRRGRAGGPARRRGSSTRCAAAGVVVFGPTADGGPAGGLQGVRQGGHGGRRACRPPGLPVVADRRRRAWPSIDRYPVVMKADGLAGRQGRRDRRLRGARRAAALEGMLGRRIASAARPSSSRSSSRASSCRVLALCDGERAVPLAPARDYKRIGEGDTGPNTGGMGCFSPVRGHRRALIERVSRDDPPARGRRARAAAARRSTACLYAGLMLTGEGPQGDRVQRPLRRPGDAGRAAAPALDLLDLLQRSAAPGGLARRRRSSGTSAAAVRSSSPPAATRRPRRRAT